MRKLIPRSGNNPPCDTPPGCELGCEGNGPGPGGTGGGPLEPPCPNQGTCDHCALEKTGAQKGIVGGDASKWWTTMPAAHWNEPDQWPIFPCMSREAFGSGGTAVINAGDSITTTMYVNADHSGLYRFELACGTQATNEAFNAAGADLTPWLALHPSKEFAPGQPPLDRSRAVGRTRAETDAYFARTVCSAATCPYRMNGEGTAHALGSPTCGPVPPAGSAQIVGPPVDASSPVQCFVEDTFQIPPSVQCRGPATLRWMWNSAEGLETYANCIDLNIEGAALPDDGGGGAGDSGAGGGGAGGIGAGDDSSWSVGITQALVALFVVGGLVAGVFWYRCKKRSPPAPSASHATVQMASAHRRGSEDPAWISEAAGTANHANRSELATPPPAPPPPAQPLPEGVRELVDKSGRTYYYMERTGETTWKRPQALPTAGAVA